MLQELWVGEQRYRAVWEVLDGASVTDVARRFGVSRQSVHTWLRRYAADACLGPQKGLDLRRCEPAVRPRARPRCAKQGLPARLASDHGEARQSTSETVSLRRTFRPIEGLMCSRTVSA